LLVIESKAIIGRLIGTKVTMGFGPASAIIMPDCFIREQKRNSTKVQNEGKIEMRKQKGFSLIELLIVVAIILIIAAIAIPNLMRARMAANTSSGAASVRTLVTGEIAYSAAFPTIGFAAQTVLGSVEGTACVPSSTTACLIDANLANNGTPPGVGKSGYTFVTAPITVAPSAIPNEFLITGTALALTTGTTAFCAVDDGVVRSVAAAAASNVAVASYAACQLLAPLTN
jgi:prepilin-type N-terminal cleavage/methylation domain-containing protein